MRQGFPAETPTVFRVVQRAVAICDPDGESDLLADFELAFEDDDEPVAALENRDRMFFEAAERIKGVLDDAGLTMAAAIATYLAFRRDEVTDDDADLLRLAARAEFGKHPPPEVAEWLRDVGVEP